MEPVYLFTMRDHTLNSRNEIVVVAECGEHQLTFEPIGRHELMDDPGMMGRVSDLACMWARTLDV